MPKCSSRRGPPDWPDAAPGKLIMARPRRAPPGTATVRPTPRESEDRALKIGLAYDLAPAGDRAEMDGPDDRFEEFDKPETIEALAEVLRCEGHDVVYLGDG